MGKKYRYWRKKQRKYDSKIEGHFWYRAQGTGYALWFLQFRNPDKVMDIIRYVKEIPRALFIFDKEKI